MRVIAILFLIAANSWGLTVPPTAPRTITTVTTNRIEVKHEPNSFLVIYQQNTDATVDLQEEVSPGLTVFSGPAGKWTIMEVVRDGNSTRYNKAICLITDAGVTPDPDPQPNPDPDPPPIDPLPPTTYNVGPIVKHALASVSQADKLVIAKLFSDYSVSLRENRLGDIHAAMKKLSAAFPPAFMPAKQAYQQAMINGWQAGKIVSIAQHAGALDEIATWLSGKQVVAPQVPIMQRMLDRQNLGAPYRVRCEMVNGQRVCFDQYGNFYYGQ
jgi:hypothetical protein